MAYSETIASTKSLSARRLLWPFALGASLVVAYAPTFMTLAQGPWQTEQEGHGPLIIAAALWLVWQSRTKLRQVSVSPFPVTGWLLLLFGLAILVLSRNQDVIFLEVASEIPVLAGCILLLAGWNVLLILAFPLGFLIFSAPVPAWLGDAITIPLKVFISDAVTSGLYALGYPIAQNGVAIQIGPYQLLVQDACSGLNSIFALSAIGVFYVYAFRWHEKIRGLILLSLIVPITIAANFLRVIALVLIAYYGGIEMLEGVLHDLTGIALFIVAVAIMFMCDGVIGGVGRIVRRIGSSKAASAKSSGV
jgi:exosortase B